MGLRAGVVTEAGNVPDDVSWQVLVEPAGGGGYLTEFDVAAACDGLPDGGSVELVLAEFDDVSGAAAGVLARRLAGVPVRFSIAPSAWQAGTYFIGLFQTAQRDYLAVEADRLRDLPA